jgi:endonuclease III
MQMPLDLPSALPFIRERLRTVFGAVRPESRLDPVSQLVKTMVSARTYDEVSWAAFIRLRAAFGDWNALADADPTEIEPIIDLVTFAEEKARRIPEALRQIRAAHGKLDLDFLKDLPLNEAMAWLARLSGVGVKGAACVLNFSTLAQPVLVVDTHMHRVTRRLGVAPRTGDTEGAYAALMEQAPPDWDAEDFFELHWLIKPHGQSICTHFDPACGLCVLRDLCPRIGLTSAPSAMTPQTDGPVRPQPRPAQGRQPETAGPW